MDAWKAGRAMQPRSSQGTSLLVTMQVMATDEGIFLGRVAFRDPATGTVRCAFGEKRMWEGGQVDVAAFAADLAGAVMDAVEWTVS